MGADMKTAVLSPLFHTIKLVCIDWRKLFAEWQEFQVDNVYSQR